MAHYRTNLNPTTHDVIISYMEDKLSRNHSRCIRIIGLEACENVNRTPLGKSLRDFAYQLLLDYKNVAVVDEFKNEIQSSCPTTQALVTKYWIMLHNRLFADKDIDWSRLVMAINVAVGIADEAVYCDNMERLADVAEWTIAFFKHILMDSWIEASGGWNMMDRQKAVLPMATPFPTRRRHSGPPIASNRITMRPAEYQRNTPSAFTTPADNSVSQFYTQVQDDFNERISKHNVGTAAVSPDRCRDFWESSGRTRSKSPARSRVPNRQTSTSRERKSMERHSWAAHLSRARDENETPNANSTSQFRPATAPCRRGNDCGRKNGPMSRTQQETQPRSVTVSCSGTLNEEIVNSQGPQGHYDPSREFAPATVPCGRKNQENVKSQGPQGHYDSNRQFTPATVSCSRQNNNGNYGTMSNHNLSVQQNGGSSAVHHASTFKPATVPCGRNNLNDVSGFNKQQIAMAQGENQFSPVTTRFSRKDQDYDSGRLNNQTSVGQQNSRVATAPRHRQGEADRRAQSASPSRAAFRNTPAADHRSLMGSSAQQGGRENHKFDGFNSVTSFGKFPVESKHFSKYTPASTSYADHPTGDYSQSQMSRHGRGQSKSQMRPVSKMPPTDDWNEVHGARGMASEFEPEYDSNYDDNDFDNANYHTFAEDDVQGLSSQY